MARPLIHNAIYYRWPTEQEIAFGVAPKEKLRILVPIKDVILGVNELCSAKLKPSIKRADGHRYYYECVNLAETIKCISE